MCFFGLISISQAVLTSSVMRWRTWAFKGVQSPALLAAFMVYSLLRTMGYGCTQCRCSTLLGQWSFDIIWEGTLWLCLPNIFLLKINQLFSNFYTVFYAVILPIMGRMMDDFLLHRQLNILSWGKSLCWHSQNNSRCFCDL